ncbi:MAG TPA: PilZ domain-containing protein [Labilithrix sp.]|jgi:hypothetical protein|nr:PilZ domain-containing protein [Labilithrix sp.]
MAEQRQVRRHPPAILRVSFEHPASGERAAVPAWDASLGGMFLETDAPLDEGSLIALEIGTPDTTVSVDARVLWTRPTKLGEDQPAGMAVRFIDLPDDVSVALNRALQGGMQDKTILGVGGLSKEPTQIGIAPGLGPSARVPRETQIGVAPPANVPATPAPPTPAPVVEAAPKPRLVLSDTSLPETPAPPAKVVDQSRLEETSPSRARLSAASELPPLPVQKTGLVGRLFLLLLLGGAAAGVYVYRDRIAALLVPPPEPTTWPAPTASEKPSGPTTDASISDASEAVALADRLRDAAVIDAATRDAAAIDKDAGAHDAGARDAGPHDAGPRDAGRDSGAGKHDAGRAPTKHP